MSFPSKQPRTRPVYKLAAIDDQEKFRSLPKPVGAYPYHLSLSEVITEEDVDVTLRDKMIFQICGDTGGIVLPTFQHHIVREMMRQFDEATSPNDKPQFFFHLGDVVYNFGQAAGYEQQYFTPFNDYPAPVFAIAGNHDADVDPFDPAKPDSLDAFMQVFCTTEPKTIPFSGNNARLSNIQPNIYYTLKTPLANIICLYGNVPRFGTITDEQRQWFIEELKSAGAEKGKVLIVCVHNATYTADINHGSSLRMQMFFNSVFEEAGIIPDIIFSGHVHNYQRFTKSYPNGKTIPFIIAGAGGYAQLHAIAELNDPLFPDTSPMFDGVELQKYCDHAHGFMKVTIEKKEEKVSLTGEYYIIDDEHTVSPAVLYDAFTININ